MQSLSIYGTSWNEPNNTSNDSGPSKKFINPARYDVCYDMDLIVFNSYFNLLGKHVDDFGTPGREIGPAMLVASGSVARTVERVSTGVVRKRTELAFSGTRKVSRRYLKPFITELLILLHPNLRKEEHIVNFTGFEWEVYPSSEGSEHLVELVPSLGIEYAHHGTMSRYLASQPLDKSLSLRQSLCENVGVGLQALHKCMIVHGDLKPDNILIFRANNPLGTTAKLCDFSHSLIIHPIDNTPVLLPGGSTAWAAPEWRQLKPPSMFKKSDIFSYGLVVWSCFSLEENPLKLREQCDGETQLENVLCEKASSTLRLTLAPLKSTKKLRQEIAKIESYAVRIFQETLCQTPESRKLQSAIPGVNQDLKDNKCSDDPSSENPITWLPMYIIPFRNQIESFELRNLHGPFYSVIPGSLAVARASVAISRHVFSSPSLYSDTDRANSAVFLFRSYLEGYGVEQTDDYINRALEWLEAALRLELSNSEEPAAWVNQARSLFENFGRPFPQGLNLQPLIENLLHNTLKWPTYVQDTLAITCKKDMVDFHEIFEKFQKSGIINEVLQKELVSGIMDSSGNPLRKMSNIDPTDRLTNDGDTLLHVAASCGNVEIAKILHEYFGVELEIENDLGWTPLWYACRYAHADFVIWITAQEGNTKTNFTIPGMHNLLTFLPNFREDQLSPVCDALCKAGADVNFETISGQTHRAYSILAVAVMLSLPKLVQVVLQENPNLRVCQSSAVLAASACNLEGLKQILDHWESHFENPSSRDELEHYLLSAASLSKFTRCWSYCKAQHLECLDYLCQRLGNLSTKTLSRWGWEAIVDGDLESFSILLDQAGAEQVVARFADPRDPGMIRRGLLEETVMLDKKRLFDFLLSRDVSVFLSPAPRQHPSLFHYIARRQLIHGRYFCEKILERGEVVDQILSQEDIHHPPLLSALLYDNLDIADFLLNAGASTDPEGNSILRLLIIRKSKAVIPAIEFLLQHPKGSPRFITDPETKFTVLHYAAGPRFDSDSTWGNDMNLIDGPQAILKVLLQFFNLPCHINAKDTYGNTPLHGAAYRGCGWAVRLLLEAGADPFACNSLGFNAWWLCTPENLFHNIWQLQQSFDYFDQSLEGLAICSKKGREECRELLGEFGTESDYLPVSSTQLLLGMLGLVDNSKTDEEDYEPWALETVPILSRWLARRRKAKQRATAGES